MSVCKSGFVPTDSLLDQAILKSENPYNRRDSEGNRFGADVAANRGVCPVIF